MNNEIAAIIAHIVATGNVELANSEMIKAVLMHHYKRTPPTFESVAEFQMWTVETIVPVRSDTWIGVHGIRTQQRPRSDSELDNARVRFVVDLEETEYGRCSYSVNKTAREETEVSFQDIIDALDNGELDSFYDKIVDEVRDGGNYDWDYCDYKYEDHEWQDSETESTSIRLDGNDSCDILLIDRNDLRGLDEGEFAVEMESAISRWRGEVIDEEESPFED